MMARFGCEEIRVKTAGSRSLKAGDDDAPILPRAVRRDVVLLICVKLLALFVIYRVFFAPHEVPPLSPAQVMTRLLGQDQARPARGH